MNHIIHNISQKPIFLKKLFMNLSDLNKYHYIIFKNVLFLSENGSSFNANVYLND